MKRKRHQRRGIIIPALAACFCIGAIVGWWLKSGAPMPAASQNAETAPVVTVATDTPSSKSPAPSQAPLLPGRAISISPGEVAATTGEPLVGPASPTSLPSAGAIGDLRSRSLRLPIDDAHVEAMKGGFEERRDAGGRSHEAVDILAPRDTPIHAVEDGTIAKLFLSKAGGTTVYQYDPSGRFCYYYAHLERYAPGLHERQRVSRGDVVGYVGTSGNAPPNTPHLHFAVFELDADRHWWKGRAIDPYLIFRP
jgi:murein DD-endopeptidase MepM/ murein hydrolase activator NlpD